MPRRKERETSSPGRLTRLQRLSPWLVILFMSLLGFLYTFRFDITAAVTVWPAWIGLGFGIVLTTLASRWRWWLLAAWIVFAILFVDETRSYPRLLVSAPTSNLRIITLNCAGGSMLAAEEVLRFKPDVVLLQESPSAPEVQALAMKLFGPAGKFVRGPDASIIARGRLVEIPLERGTHNFVAATWRPSLTRSLPIVSLRLMPPVMRIDLFLPDAWREFADNRRNRANEVLEIRDQLNRLGFLPEIVGGDFNIPPDPGVLRPLTAGLTDAFAAAGVGHGATCVHPFPCLVRIDQIWSGEAVVPVRARVIKTAHSDHRMLVVDYRWE